MFHVILRYFFFILFFSFQFHHSLKSDDSNIAKKGEDVMYDGKLCQQYLYFDKNNNCTDIMLIPYDSSNSQSPGGYLLHLYQPTTVNIPAQSLQILSNQHGFFVEKSRNAANMTNKNQFTHELQQVTELFKRGGMSQESYNKHCHDIVAEENAFKSQIAQLQQAQKTIKAIDKSERPTGTREKNRMQSTSYTEDDIKKALIILQAEQNVPKSQNKKIVKQAQRMIQTDINNTNQMNEQKKQDQSSTNANITNIDITNQHTQDQKNIISDKESIAAGDNHQPDKKIENQVLPSFDDKRVQVIQQHVHSNIIDMMLNNRVSKDVAEEVRKMIRLEAGLPDKNDAHKADDQDKNSHKENIEKDKKDSSELNKDKLDKEKTDKDAKDKDGDKKEKKADKDEAKSDNKKENRSGKPYKKPEKPPFKNIHELKKSQDAQFLKQKNNMQSLDHLRKEQAASMRDYTQTVQNIQKFSPPSYKSENSDFFRSYASQTNRDSDFFGILKKEHETSIWDVINEVHQSSLKQSQERALAEQRQLEAEMYMQNRKMEIALLDFYGYIYKRPEKDFVEVIKNQLLLESTRDEYRSMGSFSYDYWASSKPSQLKKIINDAYDKEWRLTRKIADDRINWKSASLVEISNKDKALKIAQDTINRAKIDKNKTDLELLITYGYLFKTSRQAAQELQTTQLQLGDAIGVSKKPMTTYQYWFNNKTREVAQKIQQLKQEEQLAQQKIVQEQAVWQKKHIEQACNLKAYLDDQAEYAKFLEEENNADENISECKIKDLRVDLTQLTEYTQKTDFNLKECIKNSEHRFTMPQDTALAIKKQLVPEDNFYSRKYSYSEVENIDFILKSMTKATHNTTVEIAQAALQALQNADECQTHEAHDFYKNKFTKCYDILHKKLALQSITHGVKPASVDQIDTMLQTYESYGERDHKIAGQELDDPYVVKFEKRAHALRLSKEEIATENLKKASFTMSHEARAYLMANNLNYAAFEPFTGTSIQHCLTQENLDIIESIVQAAHRYEYKQETKEFVKHTCNLAVVAQQLNQQSKIKEAAALTDLNEVFALYGQAMLNDELELAGWSALGNGLYKGTSRALYAWHQFMVRLGHDPKKTVGKMAADCKALGVCISSAAVELHQHSSLAYQIDDFIDLVQDAQEVYKKGSITPRQRRSQARQERNEKALKNGVKAVVNGSIDLITDMLNKSLEDNIADLTELTVDGLINAKAIDSLVCLSKFTGSALIEAGREIIESTPKKILDSPVMFMQTSTGELVAIAEKTGEDISLAVAQQVALQKAEKLKKVSEKTKLIKSKVAELTQPDQKKIFALKKSMKSHLNSEKIVNLERLKTIKGIDQIELYRAYTNNFHPDGIAKLKPEEILHLNLCEWLEPQARKINEKIKAAGGIKFVDANGVEGFFEEFDLFHSLLGDVRPGSIRDHTSGGHLLIPELKAALLDIGEFEHLGNGFLDIGIQYAGKDGGRFVKKTYFPLGFSIEDAVKMIEESVLNPHYIKSMQTKDLNLQGFIVTNKQGQDFAILSKNQRIQFYPMKP